MLSCLTNSYGPFGPEAALRMLPETGVRRIELPIRNAGVPSFFGETPLLTDASGPADVARVQRLLDDAGMGLSSCNVTSGNVLDEAVVERTLRKLTLAAELGVSLVVGGGGEASTSVDESRLIEQLQRIGAAAAAHGLTYCCETHPGSCQNAERMFATMQAVDHPQVRLNFDTGNLYYYNRNVDLDASLRLVAPFVRHVHLKDTPGGFEQWHFVELGSGVVDLALVRERLEAVGFRGPFSLELEGIRGEPSPTVAQLHARIAASVQHLNRCGYSP
jgi:L-ribulose-5-phosphate 3-epimerase